MKKYLLTFCALALAALTFTSCLSNSNTENIYKATLGSSECFARVYDMETGETITTQGAAYGFTYNFTAGTITIEISNLQLAANFGGLSFLLPEMQLKFNNETGFFSCEGQNITPANTQSSYVFDRLYFRSFTNRAYNNVAQPVFCLDFTLNNRYKVVLYQKNNFYFGTTTGNAIDGTTTETNTSVAYNISIDPNTNKAILRVYNGKFAPTMGSETFGVKDIPVEYTSNGYILRTEAGKTYPIFDTSNLTVEGWGMTDLNSNTIINGKTNISFKCELGEKGSYFVTANLDYVLYEKDPSNPNNPN